MGSFKENKSAAPKYPGLVERIMEALGARTQLEVAGILGVTGPSVTDWKTRGGISTDNLVEISRMTSASIHWLLTGDGPKYVPGHKAGAEAGDLDARVRCLERALVCQGLEAVSGSVTLRAALAKARVMPSLALAVWVGLCEGRSEDDIARECGVEIVRVQEVSQILLAERVSREE